MKKYDVSDLSNPSVIYEANIPECIQGICIYKDAFHNKETMYLSQSREVNDSSLLTFEYDEQITDYDTPVTTQIYPEGMEQIQMTAQGLYMLFESGAIPYRETARIPNDKLYLIRR